MASPIEKYRKYLTGAQVKQLTAKQRAYNNAHADERVQMQQDIRSQIDQGRRMLQNRGLASSPGNVISGEEPRLRARVQTPYAGVNAQLKKIETQQLTQDTVAAANKTIRARAIAKRKAALAKYQKALEKYKAAVAKNMANSAAYLAAKSAAALMNAQMKEQRRQQAAERFGSGGSASGMMNFAAAKYNAPNVSKPLQAKAQTSLGTTGRMIGMAGTKAAEAAVNKTRAQKTAEQVARETGTIMPGAGQSQLQKDFKLGQANSQFDERVARTKQEYYSEQGYSDLEKQLKDIQQQLAASKAQANQLKERSVAFNKAGANLNIAGNIEKGKVNADLIKANDHVKQLEEQEAEIRDSMQEINQEWKANEAMIRYGVLSDAELDMEIRKAEQNAAKIRSKRTGDILAANAAAEAGQAPEKESFNYAARQEENNNKLAMLQAVKNYREQQAKQKTIEDGLRLAETYRLSVPNRTGDPTYDKKRSDYSTVMAFVFDAMKNYDFDSKKETGSEYYKAINDGEVLDAIKEGKAWQIADPNASAWQKSGTKAERDTMYYREYARFMTRKEKEAFNTIYQKKGAEEADKFFEALLPTLDQRGADVIDKEAREFAQSKWGKYIASAASVPYNLVMGIVGPAENIGNALQGRETGKMQAAGHDMASTIRDARQEGMTEGERFAYGTVMSMADSLAAALVSKGTGVNIGGVALGGSAYNSAYREALDRGLDTAHAQATAIASGAFEMIFETLSIERLIAIKDAKSIGQAALNALKQGGFEASEEINTKIAEMISDYVINGDMSKLSKMYEDFRDRGYSVKEANKKVALAAGEEVGMAGLGGFVSGVGMGGGATAIQTYYINNKSEAGRLGKEVREKGLINQIQEHNFKDESFREMAANPENLSNAELGAMYATMQAENKEQRIGQDVQDAEGGVDALKKFSFENESLQELASKPELTTDDITELYKGMQEQIHEETRQKLGAEGREALPVFDKITAGVGITTNEAKTILKNPVAFKAFNDTYGSYLKYSQNESQAAQSVKKRANKVAAENRRTFGEQEAYEQPQSAQRRDTQRAAEIQQAPAQAGSVTARMTDDQKRLAAMPSESDRRGTYQTNRGSVSYEFQNANARFLTDQQKAGVSLAQAIANATGANIRIVDTMTENGMYDPNTKTLTIALDSDRGVMYTTAHELTHWLKDHDAEAYEAFEKVLVDEINKIDVTDLDGIDEDVVKWIRENNREGEALFDSLVRYEQSKDSSLSEDEARQEAVAECCEPMLSNRNVQDRLARESADTAKTIRDHLKKIKDSVERLLKGVTRSSREAKIMQSQLVDLQKVADAWADAVAKASRNAERQQKQADKKQKVKRQLSSDERDAFLTPEAQEKYSKDERFSNWKHKDLAFISAASWAGVKFSAEELLRIPKIAETQKICDDYNKRSFKEEHPLGEDPVLDKKREEWKNKLLDKDHGSAVFGDNGKIKPIYDKNGKKIGNDYSGPVEQGYHAAIVIGRPAGGKSKVFADPLSRDMKARIIDSDTVKPWIEPWYNDGLGAGYVQQESTQIANDAFEIALDRGENMVIPRIGGNSAIDLAKELKQKGYRVDLYYNDVSTESSITRAMSRFAEEGRYIGLKFLNGIGDKPLKTFLKYAENKELFDYAEWKSNDVPMGREPELIWRSGRGSLNDAYNRILQERSKGLGQAGQTNEVASIRRGLGARDVGPAEEKTGDVQKSTAKQQKQKRDVDQLDLNEPVFDDSSEREVVQRPKMDTEELDQLIEKKSYKTAFDRMIGKKKKALADFNAKTALQDGRVFSQKDCSRMAKELIKVATNSGQIAGYENITSDMKASKLAEELATLAPKVWDAMHGNIDQAKTLEDMRSLTGEIMKSVYGKNVIGEDQIKQLRETVPKEIYLNPEQVGNLKNSGTNVYAYGKKLSAALGKTVVVRNANAAHTANLDSVWPTIAERIGQDYNNISDADEPLALMDIAEQNRSRTESVYGNGESSQEMAEQLMDALMSKVMELVPVKQNVTTEEAQREVMNELAERASFLKNRGDRLQEQLDKVNREYQEARRDNREDVRGYEQQLKDLKATIKQNEAAIKSLTAERDSLKENIKRTKEQVDKRVENATKAVMLKYDNKLARATKSMERQSQERERKAFQQGKKTQREIQIKRNLEMSLKSSLAKLATMSAHPSTKKHVPIELMDSLSDYMRMMSNCILQQGKKMDNQILIRLENAYSKLADPGEGAFAVIQDKEIRDQLAELTRVTYGRTFADLNVDEVLAIQKTMKAVMTSITNANKLIGREKRTGIQETAVNLIDEMNKAKEVPFSKYMFRILSPERFARYATNYKADSVLVNEMEELNKGAIEKERIAMEGNKLFADFVSKYGKEYETWFGKKAKWEQVEGAEDMDGKPVYVTPAMKLSLIMHGRNAQNLNHMIKGGAMIPDMKLYKQGKLAEAYAAGQRVMINHVMTEQLEKTLTEAEKAYLKCVENLLWDYTPRVINNVSVQLYGYRKATVDKYFPIKTDRNFTQTNLEGVIYNGSIEGMGMLKERASFANNPLMVEDINQVVKRQIDNTALFGGLAIPVRNFTRIYNTQVERGGESVKNAMSKQLKPDGMKILEKVLTDLQQKPKVDGYKAMLGKIQSGYVQATLAVNLSTTMKQAASYPTAAAVVGWKPLLKALAKGGRNGAVISRADMDLIDKYTPLLYIRQQGMIDRDVADYKINGKSWAEKMPGLMDWIRKVDVATVGRLWYAAEYYVQDNNPDLVKGSDAYYKETANVFNRIVQETQPNYSVMQRPDVLRTESDLMRSITMFKTQAFQNGGIVVDAIGEFKATRNLDKNDARRIAANRKLANMITSQVVQNVVVTGMTLLASAIKNRMNGWRDDDDEITGESIAENFALNMASTAAGSFWMGSELFDVIMAGLNKVTGRDIYTVYDKSSPVTDVINDLKDGIESLGKVVNMISNGEKNQWKEYDKQLNKVATGISEVAGVPYKNIRQLIEGGVNWYKDIRTATETGEMDWFRSSSKSMDSEKTAEAYKQWTAAGNSGKQFFYYKKALKEITGEGAADAKRAMLQGDESLTADQKAMLESMLIYSGKNETRIENGTLQKLTADGWETITDYTDQTMFNLSQMSPTRFENAQEMISAGVKAETVDEVWTYYTGLPTGDNKNDKFRAWLMEKPYSAADKALIDRYVIGNKTVYDYTDQFSFARSGMSESQQKNADAARATGVADTFAIEAAQKYAKTGKQAEFREWLFDQKISNDQKAKIDRAFTGKETVPDYSDKGWLEVYEMDGSSEKKVYAKAVKAYEAEKIQPATFAKFYSQYKTIDGKDASGKSKKGLKRDRIKKLIRSLGLSKSQRAYMYKNFMT